MWSHELDSTILAGPFQLGVFHDAVIHGAHEGRNCGLVNPHGVICVRTTPEGRRETPAVQPARRTAVTPRTGCGSVGRPHAPRATVRSRAAQEPSSPRTGPEVPTRPLSPAPNRPFPGSPSQLAINFVIFLAAKAVTNGSDFVSPPRPRLDLLCLRYREIGLHSKCFSGRTRSPRCLFAPSLLISVTDPQWPRSVPDRPSSHLVPPAPRSGPVPTGVRGRGTAGRGTRRRKNERWGGGKARYKNRLTPGPPFRSRCSNPRRGAAQPRLTGRPPPRRGAVAARGRWRGQVRPAPRCGRRRLIKEAGRAWRVVRLGR